MHKTRTGALMGQLVTVMAVVITITWLLSRSRKHLPRRSMPKQRVKSSGSSTNRSEISSCNSSRICKNNRKYHRRSRETRVRSSERALVGSMSSNKRWSRRLSNLTRVANRPSNRGNLTKSSPRTRSNWSTTLRAIIIATMAAQRLQQQVALDNSKSHSSATQSMCTTRSN